MTLYQRWLETARRHAEAIALYEHTERRTWRFKDLAATVEATPEPSDPVVFPQGKNARFIIDLLIAWRFGKPACPIEGHRPSLPSKPLPTQCIHIKTTSASSGPSRLITFNASQLIADCDHIVATMGLRREWPNLGAISLAHSYGFSNLVLPLLLCGIPLILSSSNLPGALHEAGAQFDHLTLPAVPALWEAWHKTDAIPSHTRLAISAGAPLPIQLEHEVYEKNGLKIHNFYGASECGGIAYDRSPHPREDAAYVGSPLEGVELTLDADSRLIVHSDAVGQGYWPEPSPTLGHGRYVSEDLAEWTEDGIRLKGRTGDAIHIGGRKVLPEDIEAALLRHPAISDSLVFGIPSSTGGRQEEIVACVVLASATSDQDIRHFLSHHLPAWQIPRRFARLDAIEYNARGKRSRAAWKNWYLSSGHLGRGRERE